MKKIFNKQIFMKTLKTALTLAFLFSFFIANNVNAEIVSTGTLSNGATGKVEIQDNSKIITDTGELNVAVDFDPDSDNATQFKLPGGVSSIYVNLKSPSGTIFASRKILSVSNGKPTSAPIFTYMYPIADYFITYPDPTLSGNKAFLTIEDQNSKLYYKSDEFQVFTYTKQQASSYSSTPANSGTSTGTTSSGSTSGTKSTSATNTATQSATGATGTAGNQGAVNSASGVTAGGTTGGNPASGTTGTETPKSGLQITLTNPLKSNTLEEFVQIVLGVILKFLIPILAILFMYTGFKLVTAKGDVKALTAAKQDFLNLVIGAVLILGAWTFGSIIMNTLKEIGILN
jgi:hypothetical protein